MGSGIAMMGFGVLMMRIGLVVLVTVTALLVWAIVHFASRRATGDAARRALEERLARGEIGEDEYQRIRRQLG